MFTPEWFVSLATIVLIDLLLAGDNAIVIALAARKLPPHPPKKSRPRQRTTPLLDCRRLLAKGDDEPDTPAATFWAAMYTIIIADTVMILAIVGASRGDWRTLH